MTCASISRLTEGAGQVVEGAQDITVGSSRFRLVETIADFGVAEAGCDFILGKNSRGVAAYKKYLIGASVENVFELGIWRGGSTAFFYELLQPKVLAAVDIGPPVAVLDQWIDRRALGDRVKVFYGVDQSDTARLGQICEEVFADKPLDLVLDDASHMLEQTRLSFNAMFPRLKTGGTYIIEDWAWGECFRGMEALLNAQLRDAKPMSALIYEIVAASGRSPSVVDEVVVSNAFVLVRRGPADLAPDFDIRHFG